MKGGCHQGVSEHQAKRSIARLSSTSYPITSLVAVSTPIGMPLHLSEGIEELGACSRRLLFSSDGGIGDRHVLLEDRELEILCLGEGEAAGKTKRTVKKGKGKSSRACVEKSLASVGLEGGAEGNPNGKKDKGESPTCFPNGDLCRRLSNLSQGWKMIWWLPP